MNAPNITRAQVIAAAKDSVSMDYVRTRIRELLAEGERPIAIRDRFAGLYAASLAYGGEHNAHWLFGAMLCDRLFGFRLAVDSARISA